MGGEPGPERDDKADKDVSSPSERAKELLGQVIAERYRIDSVIAMGGFGAVYLGEHVHMRKRVAVKMLHPETEGLPELVQRFERESIVGAHAMHPNVASATDFGKLEDGSYYLVLEYIDGTTLHKLLKEGPIPLQRAVEIARQIARGLEAIHQLDIVHRDLKTHNVMVSDGPPLVVKLIDFGFAKLPVERYVSDPKQAAALTTGEKVFGTIGFLAPEVTFGMHAIGPASDLYALGVIMYELLAGKHPYSTTKGPQLLVCHQLDPPPPFRKRAPDRKIPAALEAVVMRLLEKAPDDRFPNAGAVVDAIDAAMRGEREAAKKPAAKKETADEKPATKDESSKADEPAKAAKSAVAEKPAKKAEPAKTKKAEPAKTKKAEPAKTKKAEPASKPRRSEQQPKTEAKPARAAGRKKTRPRRLERGLQLLIGALVVFGLVVYFVPSLRQRVAAMVGGDRPAPTATPSGPTAHEPLEPPPADATAARPATTASEKPRPTRIDGVDAAGWRTELRDAAAKKATEEGAQAILALAEIDPEAFTQPAVADDVVAVAKALAREDNKAVDPVFALLASDKIGIAGPDVLYQLATRHGGSKGAKRAAELLKRKDVLAQASPALRIALELRETPCHEKPKLFQRAEADGDTRAFQLLSELRPPRCVTPGGCCHEGDPRYQAAMRKLSKAATRGTAP